MKHSLVLIPLLASCAAATQPSVPVPSGQYIFQHRFAEHPNMPSVSMTARIDGAHIILVNEAQSSAFPKGVVADGTLMWHAGSRQWIIGKTGADSHAKEVGGCSDGL